jgi:hypothetical protein
MVANNSWLNAARSAALRKRISVSMDSVASRCSVANARRSKAPTSCTARAARAIR